MVFQLLKQPEPVAHSFQSGSVLCDGDSPLRNQAPLWPVPDMAAGWALKGGGAGSDDGDGGDSYC